MARKFDNQDLELPTGEKIRVGTYQGSEGELSIKLRLPEEWCVTQVFRPSPEAVDKSGKTVIVLDRHA